MRDKGVVEEAKAGVSSGLCTYIIDRIDIRISGIREIIVTDYCN